MEKTKISELERMGDEENSEKVNSGFSYKIFSPSYEIIDESFGPNTYSVDCCMCNPQRC